MARRSASAATGTGQPETGTTGSAPTYAKAKPPGSRASYVQDVLRSEILSGAMPPGTPILQDKVAERLGVSITPVREALRNLESVGLVVYEPNFGAKVAELAAGEMEELYLLRAAVEGLAARLAATSISPAEVQRLHEIHGELRTAVDAGDPSRMAAASRQFHAQIARAGGRSIIARHLQWIWESHPIPIEQSVWSNPKVAAQAVDSNARLLALLEVGDAEGAENHMVQQVRLAASARLATMHSREEKSGA
ncbi:GntR family transcriptional regulator [Nocardia sp. NPDC046763]|uniref:GntR family transcriptional regulator n=1 Tax=Nocardia sp. NPDC046763 TaxID=3155256 RepID=UPI0033DF5057